MNSSVRVCAETSKSKQLKRANSYEVQANRPGWDFAGVIAAASETEGVKSSIAKAADGL